MKSAPREMASDGVIVRFWSSADISSAGRTPGVIIVTPSPTFFRIPEISWGEQTNDVAPALTARFANAWAALRAVP